MTVRQLIAYLQTQDQDLPVAYSCYSESRLLEDGEIEVKNLSYPRKDGHVAECRPEEWWDRKYLLLPGN